MVDVVECESVMLVVASITVEVKAKQIDAFDKLKVVLVMRAPGMLQFGSLALPARCLSSLFVACILSSPFVVTQLSTRLQ